MIRQNKPVIETMVNTVALALTSLGVVSLTNGNNWGYANITFGMFLEWFKYWGRQRKLW